MSGLDGKVLTEDILKNINWPFVSLDKMLEFYREFPRLRHNIHSKAIFHN